MYSRTSENNCENKKKPAILEMIFLALENSMNEKKFLNLNANNDILTESVNKSWMVRSTNGMPDKSTGLDERECAP